MCAWLAYRRAIHDLFGVQPELHWLPIYADHRRLRSPHYSSTGEYDLVQSSKFLLGRFRLACWFGFRSCAHPAVRRSCGLCRWVGRRRVSCPRFGWKGRMRSRVSPRSPVSLRPASASPVHRPVPLNCLCRGGGGETAKNRLC